MESTSASGLILSLYDQGYSQSEIVKEMATRPELGTFDRWRVRRIIFKMSNQRENSRRIFEIREMMVEALAILREIRTIDQKRLTARMKTVESQIPTKLGSAIDKAKPGEPQEIASSLR